MKIGKWIQQQFCYRKRDFHEKENYYFCNLYCVGCGNYCFYKGSSIDYSFIASFSDIGFLMLTIIVPYLSIGTDMANDILKKILFNIDIGKILG